MGSGPYSGIGLGGVGQGLSQAGETISRNQQTNTQRAADQKNLDRQRQDQLTQQNRNNALQGLAYAQQGYDALTKQQQALLTMDTSGWTPERLAARDAQLKQIQTQFQKIQADIGKYTQAPELADIAPMVQAAFQPITGVQYNPNEFSNNLQIFDRSRADVATIYQAVKDAETKGDFAAMSDLLPQLQRAESQLGDLSGKLGVGNSFMPSEFFNARSADELFARDLQAGWAKLVRDNATVFADKLDAGEWERIQSAAANRNLTAEDVRMLQGRLDTGNLANAARNALAAGKYGEAKAAYDILKSRGPEVLATLGDDTKAFAVFEDPNSDASIRAKADLDKTVLANNYTVAGTKQATATTTQIDQRTSNYYAEQYQEAKKNGDAAGMAFYRSKLAGDPQYGDLLSSYDQDVAVVRENEQLGLSTNRLNVRLKELGVDQLEQELDKGQVDIITKAYQEGTLHLLPQSVQDKVKAWYLKNNPTDGQAQFDALLDRSRTAEKNNQDAIAVDRRYKAAQARDAEATATYKEKVLPVVGAKDVKQGELDIAQIDVALGQMGMYGKLKAQQALYDFYKAGGKLDQKTIDFAHKWGINLNSIRELQSFDQDTRDAFRNDAQDRRIEAMLKSPDLYVKNDKEINELAKGLGVSPNIVRGWLSTNAQYVETTRNLTVAQAKATLLSTRAQTALTGEQITNAQFENSTMNPLQAEQARQNIKSTVQDQWVKRYNMNIAWQQLGLEKERVAISWQDLYDRQTTNGLTGLTNYRAGLQGSIVAGQALFTEQANRVAELEKGNPGLPNAVQGFRYVRNNGQIVYNADGSPQLEPVANGESAEVFQARNNGKNVGEYVAALNARNAAQRELSSDQAALRGLTTASAEVLGRLQPGQGQNIVQEVFSNLAGLTNTNPLAPQQGPQGPQGRNFDGSVKQVGAAPQGFRAKSDAAARYGGHEDPGKLYALFYAESSFGTRTSNYKGKDYVGPGQIGKAAEADVNNLLKSQGKPTLDRTNPDDNMKIASIYFNMKLKEFGGDLGKAYAAYNWGSGRVREMIRTGGWDESKLPAETQTGIANIRAAYASYGGGAGPTGTTGAAPQVTPGSPELSKSLTTALAPVVKNGRFYADVTQKESLYTTADNGKGYVVLNPIQARNVVSTLLTTIERNSNYKDLRQLKPAEIATIVKGVMREQKFQGTLLADDKNLVRLVTEYLKK